MSDIFILSSLNINGAEIEKYLILEETENFIKIELKLAANNEDRCPKCKRNVSRIQDYSYKTYTYYGLVTKTIIIVFDQKRFRCDCGKTVMQHNPFMKRSPKYKLTLNAKKAIIELLKENIPSSLIANMVGLSDQTVLNVIKEINPNPRPLGSILCIDEFSYKKVRGKNNYGCLLINGDTNRIIDVLPDRKDDTIVRFLNNATSKLKENPIKYVCMDMYEPYRNSLKRYDPNVTIIVDKFHLIRRFNKVIDDTRIRIMKSFDKENYDYWLLKKFHKKLLKKELDKQFYKILIKFQKIKKRRYECEIVEEMLNIDNELRLVYEKMHHWIANHDNWNETQARSELEKLISFIEYHSEILELQPLGATLKTRKEEIINSFRLIDGRKLTNAISESTIRKIKDLKRTLHGFNSFPAFRARCFLILNKK